MPFCNFSPVIPLSAQEIEFTLEYNIKDESLEISDNFNKNIGFSKNKETITVIFKDVLTDFKEIGFAENIHTINLPLNNGETAIFKLTAFGIYNENKKLYSVMGKLIDVTEEEKEKEELITRSQIDGLTGIYNTATTKSLIAKSILNRATDNNDALIIIDCDKFKNINDTYGHLTGDSVLENIAKALKLTFRKNDIIGRICGDEFCVYMHNIPSADFVRVKSLHLFALIKELNKEFNLTVSIGIAVLNSNSSYEELFAKADEAMYVAKENKQTKVIIYGEDTTKSH